MPGASNHERVPPPGITRGADGPAIRNRRWIAIVVVAVFLGSPLMAFLLLGSRPGVGWLIGPPLTAAIAAPFLGYFAWRSDRRDIAKCRYEACLRCRYSLRGMPSTGICPECGDAYDIDQVRRSWRWTYEEFGG
jgi:hypothetical protein